MTVKNPSRYLVTAALPYANGPLHIGHIAGCYLPADIFVRFLKSIGKDVKFVCGSDEHGMAITMKAKKEGKTPTQIVDHFHAIMQQGFKDFGIQFDIYSRTSKPIHHQTAQDFFTNLYHKGVFKEQVTDQYFDEQANQFLADRYIKGTCPHCQNTEAYGDQCEKCGSTLNPTDLINPVSVLSGAKPIVKQTKNWFLPLEEFQERLEKFLETKRTSWKPNVYGQCKSWLNQGLQARAMTRDLDWGIKVPVADAEGKVLYVWFDAPIGYISATKELLPDTWEKYWKDPDSELVHFIGKDNIVFHCLIFPAMLMAHGEYILPANVPANEFLNLEGNKISTSRNWAVWLHAYLEDFENKQDELRYVLTSIAPETSDSEFTWADFQARVNNELVAVLGNFVNRIAVLFQKYYGGELPANALPGIQFAEVQKEIDEAYYSVKENTEHYRFRQGLHAIMDLARFGNKFLTVHEPWKKVKENPEEVLKVLSDCLHLCVHLGKIMQSYLPFTSQKIERMFHVSYSQNFGQEIELLPGHKLGEPLLLFKKIEDSEVAAQIQKLKDSVQENKNANPKNVAEPQETIEFAKESNELQDEDGNETIKKLTKFIYEKYGVKLERLSREEEIGRMEGGEILPEATIIAERSEGESSKDGKTDNIQRQTEKLIEFAKSKGIWHESYIPQEFSEKINVKTVESDVYIDIGDTVTKVNSGVNYIDPLDFFDSLSVWNILFPETKYTLEGFTQIDGKLAYIVSQCFVDAERSAEIDEIREELRKRGFDDGGSRTKGFYHPGFNIWLRDLNEGNVFIDKNNNVIFVDAYVDMNTKEKGMGGTKVINPTKFFKTEPKETIEFTDFEKLDLRVATILQAQRVPKTDKLMQLEVDLGFEKRTVVSGIAAHYNPEEIIGLQVMMVINLAPRKIKGIESKGMILMAESEGKLCFMQPQVPVQNGAEIR